MGKEFIVVTRPGHEYRTPDGALRQVVSRTEDYANDYFSKGRDSLDMFSDYHVSAHRSRRYLVEKEADLDSLAYLLQPLSGNALEQYREKARRAKQFCDQHQFTLAACGVLFTLLLQGQRYRLHNTFTGR